ncbi:MAG: DNA mismatch repair protein MutS [Acetobacteraceae bacterium]
MEIPQRGPRGQSRAEIANGATPALAQWFAIKAQHPDALIFFRMGDFYEMFFDDAVAGAAALDIALTGRGEYQGQKVPMCGVPAAAAEIYLARLIRRGFRVAVAEQLETAAERRPGGPIRREMVRLVTPGTLIEEALLEPARPNLLLALAPLKEVLGTAWLEISTGLFQTEALAPGALTSLIARLDPAEILAPEALDLGEFASRGTPLAALPPAERARRELAEAFGIAQLDAFGSFTDAEAVAAAAALSYVRSTQGGRLPRLSPPASQLNEAVLAIDAATRASLEILRTRDGRREPTLVSAVDRTLTAPGARLLAERLAAPLRDPVVIGARGDCWAWLLGEPALVASVRGTLGGSPDMSRALGRISLGRGGARELAALRDGLRIGHRLAALLSPPLPAMINAARSALGQGRELAERLTAALAERPPARLDEEGAIAAGFDAELDRERALRDESRRLLAGLERELASRLGISGLKIRHHGQLGYVVEVAQAAVERLSAEPGFVLRQGMANGARFSNAELAELDRQIRSAADRAGAREQALIRELAQTALAEAEAITGVARALAELDLAQSAALIAEGGRWSRPLVSDGTEFRIRAGRHPVVEAALGSRQAFVPNDCDLAPERRVLLLTGPNMAGKSTYLRQNALIAILAQAGLPVPAEAAEIGVIDRLFSRVGAADDIAGGQSTFMVEMTETSAILRQAGPRSLVVVDEIGRGTATLDGLAIAWAVLESLHSGLRCRTIFATHFHELARLATELPRLRPHAMRVKEWHGGVVFLHEVAEGAAGRSFGVAVAKLAGVPPQVVARAAALLARLEERGAELTAPAELPLFATAHPSIEKGPIEKESDPLHALVAELDPDSLSPKAAHEFLYRLKALIPVHPCEQPQERDALERDAL